MTAKVYYNTDSPICLRGDGASYCAHCGVPRGTGEHDEEVSCRSGHNHCFVYNSEDYDAALSALRYMRERYLTLLDNAGAGILDRLTYPELIAANTILRLHPTK